jgi:glycosyltransferase involved in cell wall biosynthesis
MRVLVVTDWPALEGGTERYVELVVESLRAQGDDVRLMTSSAGSAAGGTADYVAFGSNRRSAQAGLQVVNPSAVATLRRALREFRPDAVYLTIFLPHLSPAILVPLRDVPTVMTILDYKPVCMNSTRIRRDGSHCESQAGAICWQGGCVSLLHYLRDRTRYSMFRGGMARMQRVQTISAWMRDVLAEAGIDAEMRELPVTTPAPGYERRRAATPTFAYGGRFAWVKGVDDLLHAFAVVRERFPDAQLRLYGDGPEREALMRVAADLRLGGVTWNVGMVPGWADKIGDAWSAVLPSRFREPLGLVAIESIVRRVPVIATDGGGFRESVEPGVTGTLVRDGDPLALAAAMIDAVERPLEVPADVAEALALRHDPAAHALSLRADLASPRTLVPA